MLQLAKRVPGDARPLWAAHLGRAPVKQRLERRDSIVLRALTAAPGAHEGAVGDGPAAPALGPAPEAGADAARERIVRDDIADMQVPAILKSILVPYQEAAW